ncbi:Histone-lysine N-methyltransferase SETMAR [Eumeta japonica]|uniref:Histone-lysine N-methyltransferase SETMAR n=1 Tax=Eumeta variegata TaxID=151549 RepID=A0A4C1W0A5_EUMVA|nr:Histone-lysine N-methyltransferase SETMAR [Eumeta japonica]
MRQRGMKEIRSAVHISNLTLKCLNNEIKISGADAEELMSSHKEAITEMFFRDCVAMEIIKNKEFGFRSQITLLRQDTCRLIKNFDIVEAQGSTLINQSPAMLPQRKLLLHACILWECGISLVELVHFHAVAQLITACSVKVDLSSDLLLIRNQIGEREDIRRGTGLRRRQLRGAADKSAAQAESSNLSNIEHRAVIKYFVKKGKTPKEIFEDMVSVLLESAPSYTMVKKWARLFQQERESCEDDPRPGRPVTVVTEENVRKIEKLVLADGRIKLWQIAEEFQISKKRFGEIIHEHMNMRKISARWVPKMLTPFDKQRRLQTSKDFLELVGDNIDEICDRIVTVDETWVRQYDPESKQESMQSTKKGERPPKKFKVREAVVQKRRGKLSRGVLFLQDNAQSVHTARVSRQALKDTGFSEIDHPPYSPDIAPSDYFLFSNLKKELRGGRFVDDNQMKMAVESHFDCKEKEYFLGGLKALYTRSFFFKLLSHIPVTNYLSSIRSDCAPGGRTGLTPSQCQQETTASSTAFEPNDLFVDVKKKEIGGHRASLSNGQNIARRRRYSQVTGGSDLVLYAFRLVTVYVLVYEHRAVFRHICGQSIHFFSSVINERKQFKYSSGNRWLWKFADGAARDADLYFSGRSPVLCTSAGGGAIGEVAALDFSRPDLGPLPIKTRRPFLPGDISTRRNTPISVLPASFCAPQLHCATWPSKRRRAVVLETAAPAESEDITQKILWMRISRERTDSRVGDEMHTAGHCKCRGITGIICELSNIAQFEDIRVILLGETKLRPQQELRLPNYITYRQVSPRVMAYRDTVALVRKDVMNETVEQAEYASMCSQDIGVNSAEDELRIFAVYRSPGSSLYVQDIHTILSVPTPTLIPRDLNAEHNTWGSHSVNNARRSFMENAESR